MGCENAPKYTCGDRKSNARCVFYDLPVPEYSKLDEEDCVTIEETTEDIYKLVSWLKESIDTEDFEIECLEVDKVKDTYRKDNNRYLLVDIVKELVKKSCSNNDKSDQSINNILSNLDYKCLVDDCGQKPGSLQELLQLIINKSCN